jgi:hypothetical protein
MVKSIEPLPWEAHGEIIFSTIVGAQVKIISSTKI